MAKDCRLTIRYGSDLDAWLDQQAESRGMDKGTFVRMALYERKNGEASQSAQIERATPVRRDILDVNDTTLTIEYPEGHPMRYKAHEATPPDAVEEEGAVDPDDLVASAMRLPEAQAAPVQDTNVAPVGAGVRPLIRRPTPFTPAAQGHQRLDQFFASRN